MELKKEVRKQLLGLVLLFSSALLAASWGLAGEPSRLVIIPFKMNTDRDLSFMQQGIVDMLTSRLSSGDTMVVGRHDTDRALQEISAPINEEIARTIGTKLQADYVLFGSLTMFGNSMSLDVRLVDVRQKGPARTFFGQGKATDDVIPQINLLATQINETVFGRPVAQRQPPAQVTEPRAAHTHPERLMDEEVTEPRATQAHPESLIVGEVSGETEVSPATAIAESETAPSVTTSEGFWRSRNFDIFIKGIAIGDVDGDGMKEVVFIADRRVHVYRLHNQGLVKLWEKAAKKGTRLISVDVADVNGNRRAEMFVTSLKMPGDRLDSFVLEWDGSSFQQISEGAPWYYRVMDLPHQGQALLGQKRAMDKPFVPGVYQLAWQNGGYNPQTPLALPKGTNIFGFAQGDVMNNGLQMTVALDKEDRLRLFSLAGKEEWKSGERYGGSMKYVESWAKDEDTPDRFYLPQRIFVRDLDGNGKQEVIVASNEGTFGRLFARLRKFESGCMASLSWKGPALAVNWQTPKVSGHISDYNIGDFDNDGEEELLIVQVNKQGTPLTSASSSIFGYEPTQGRE